MSVEPIVSKMRPKHQKSSLCTPYKPLIKKAGTLVDELSLPVLPLGSY